ncbi:hypothetical protein [Pedobacter nyackensis]|uniref:hypothetical protein n=1 Tax=Pedobacter nyackensis TaxID=475255 RepID=UPI00292F5FA5|nr:hypothetical protein [Pedobacter nyackensis]
MKLLILTLAFSAITIASCTNEQKVKQADDTVAKVIAVDTTFTSSRPRTSSSDCYVYIKNRDTASLKINIEGEELTGELDYKLFEKDSNKGTIAGEMKGDTIIAEYTFDSEGMRSVREVVFVKKDDGKIYEGSGDVMEKGGKMIFKDRSTLKFGPAIVFTKTNCK